MQGVRAIQPSFSKDKWLLDVCAKRLSVWGAGGVLAHLFYPKCVDEVCAFFKLRSRYCPEIAVHFLGFMSNTLVRDGGLLGVSINLSQMRNMAFTGTQVDVGAGVGVMRLAREVEKNDQLGAAFLVGIPGSVGGALMMNAGAHGFSIWDYVCFIEVVDQQGVLHSLTPKDCEIGYRFCRLPIYGVIVGARFCFEDNNAKLGCAHYLLVRKNTQPVDQRSCGSVFKNPPTDFAGLLIEAAGLKGFGIGGAKVSSKHANFIVNVKQATATDIEYLIDHIQHVVRSKMGVDLEKEVRIVGND